MMDTMTFATTTKLAMSAEEVCEALGVSERTLRDWTKAGKIPAMKVGRRVLYPVDQLKQWMESQTHGQRNQSA
jgi:excisionase family DNA binding protein